MSGGGGMDGASVAAPDGAAEGRPQLEHALQVSEDRLRLAQEAGGIGVWDWDLRTDAITWSDQQFRVLGLDPGRDAADPYAGWLRVLHPDDRAAADAMVQAQRRSPGPFSMEFRVLTPDGWRWILGKGLVSRGPDGMPLRMVGVNIDITDRKRGEEALARNEAALRRTAEDLERKVAERTAELAASEARFRAYFENAEDFLIDIEATPDGRFLFRACNPAMERAHGLRSARIAGRPLEEVLDPEMAPRLLAVLRRCLDDGLVRYEPTVRTLDGLREFDTLLYVVRGSGAEPGGSRRILGSARDVTRRREMERRMAQVEKLSALGQLAGGIAHDINNVLQGVVGAAALIERRPDDPEPVRRLARLLIGAAGRGSAITRRLLAFARRDELRAEPVAPGPLLDGMREILAPALGAGIAVGLDVAADLPPLLADRGQLETVLVNLAVNARDAMPKGGTLTLSARLEPVAGNAHRAGLAPGRYLALTVADTGDGMDAATLARATEPFFTTKPMGSGTGLGLSMARGFAEQSGGALWLDSAPGHGTVVTLFLPEANRRPAPQTVPAAPKVPEWVSPLVLVVDDDALVRGTLAAGLAEDGYRVIAADSGEAALALLDADDQRPDALVTDLSMPGMDGFALIRAVQARQRAVPAVLLTGYAGDAAALALGGVLAGRVAVLRKPVLRHEVADRLRALLAVRRTS